MLDRFTGDDGRSRLVEVLKRQPVVMGDRALASAIAKHSQLREFSAGERLIEQGGDDNGVFLILVGRVAVDVNGRRVAIRGQGTHVGEMAAIDPAGRRSATVTALEQTVVAMLMESELTVIAATHPEIWRRFAIELAERLRQRQKFFREPNARPRVFIGSAAERLAVAQCIQLGLDHVDADVQVWTDGVFRPSGFALSAIVEAADRADFGVFVVAADDVVDRRGESLHIPRDNVIFELGLFVGTVGTSRTFIVKPRRSGVALPTDLLGMTPIEYTEGDEPNLPALLGPVCTTLRDAIARLGVR
ncbi:MAG: nucleotide-binding protein [Chloroflexota bacterium]